MCRGGSLEWVCKYCNYKINLSLKMTQKWIEIYKRLKGLFIWT